jgi:hypothetical protein
MDGVTQIKHDDLFASPDRRTAYYADAASLAKQVIRASGRALTAGGTKSWTFLVRTPDPVEAGIRAILRNALREMSSVDKRSVSISGSNMTLNPDLVFGKRAAVADVKYKIAGAEWNRADLYEVIAFSAAVGATEAAIITFRAADQPGLPSVRIGDFRVAELAWPAASTISPSEAAAMLATRTATWLGVRAGAAGVRSDVAVKPSAAA